MNVRKSALMIGSLTILMLPFQRAYGQPKPEVVKFEPFTWGSEPPSDCPFEPSRDKKLLFSCGSWECIRVVIFPANHRQEI